MDLKKSQNDIIRVDIYFTILAIIVGIFYPKLWLFYTALGVNLTLLLTYLTLTKYYFMINGLSMANKFVGKVNKQLEAMNGQVSREI